MTALAPHRAEPDLSFLLDRASHVLRTRMAAALAEIGLTARMHCVLVHAVEEERTQIQLAEIGDMDKTTMVVTVDALERAGLAERRPSGTDRRARIIAVTAEGERVVVAADAIVALTYSDVLASLPERQREPFLDSLRRLVDGRLSTPPECEKPPRRRAPRAPAAAVP